MWTYAARCGKLRHVTPPASWSDRFKAARKRAGFSSAEKLAEHVGVSERQAIRWETDDALPNGSSREKLAAINRAFAKLIAELPKEEKRRAEIGRRMSVVERRMTALEAKLEARLANLQPPP
jgi:transcriptional regulator with XRE-family HTH domain